MLALMLSLMLREDGWEISFKTIVTWLAILIMLVVTSGMRIREIAALSEDDIDFVKKEIYVHRTLLYAKYEEDTQKTFHFEDPKTDSSTRTIPMNKQCLSALKKQINI